METFRLHDIFIKEDFIRAHDIKWQVSLLKNRTEIIRYAIISVIVLIIGVLTRTEEAPINGLLKLGIGFSAIVLFLIFNRIYAKQQYDVKVAKIAEKFESLKMEYTYEFSNESIKYWDFEKMIDFKWSVFTHYSIYKDYLILVLNNSLIESYIFEKKESDLEDYNRVLEITKSKLEYKKIK